MEVLKRRTVPDVVKMEFTLQTLQWLSLQIP